MHHPSTNISKWIFSCLACLLFSGVGMAQSIPVHNNNFIQSPLFYVFLFLGIAAFFMLLYFFRARLLQRQKIRLEEQVKEQTATLENTILLLRVKKKELEDSNHIKNKLIALLSHDMITPLQFISLVSEHLQQFPDDTAEMQSGLEQIKGSSDQLIHMADDLLSWMKAQDDQFELAIDTVELRDMIDEKLSFFTPLTESESVSIKNEVPPGTVCNTDQRLLAIILHNIISNAFKFTIKGSIVISSTEMNEDTVVKVADTGIGMNAEKLRQVQHAIQSTGQQEASAIAGKGMGLMLIHDLARILKIRIDYSSEKEMGTAVTLFIPKGRDLK